MKRQIRNHLMVALGLVAAPAFGQAWEPVTGEERLERLFDNTTFVATLSGNVTATARYLPDGTGTLEAWGGVFDRRWEVVSSEVVCITGGFDRNCYRIERDPSGGNRYQAIHEETGERIDFTVSGERNELDVAPDREATNAGGAAEPSAAELALQLSNPTAPVMTIGNNFDFITFDGDLEGASDETAFRYVFQTVFPYKLGDGGTLFFRPAIPVLFNDPVPEGQGQYASVGTDLGDIGFDFSYGKTEKSGLLWGYGVVGTLPTATDDRVGKDLWGLGPELLLGYIQKWGVVGGVIAHQWDIGGSGDGDIDLTTINYFYGFQLGNGWQLAAGPTISYDHTRNSGDRWTVPLGIGLAKTQVIGGRPWKFQLQYWNYVDAPEAFGPEHQLRLSINPVVRAPWNEGR